MKLSFNFIIEKMDLCQDGIDRILKSDIDINKKYDIEEIKQLILEGKIELYANDIVFLVDKIKNLRTEESFDFILSVPLDPKISLSWEDLYLILFRDFDGFRTPKYIDDFYKLKPNKENRELLNQILRGVM